MTCGDNSQIERCILSRQFFTCVFENHSFSTTLESNSSYISSFLRSLDRSMSGQFVLDAHRIKLRSYSFKGDWVLLLRWSIFSRSCSLCTHWLSFSLLSLAFLLFLLLLRSLLFATLFRGFSPLCFWFSYRSTPTLTNLLSEELHEIVPCCGIWMRLWIRCIAS